jgi:hypothetical protein
MKRFIAIAILTLATFLAFAQSVTSSQDSSSTTFGNSLSFRTEKQKKYIINDNIVFATYNLTPTVQEQEIADLEGRECKALKERDAAALKQLWSRDFTLDTQQNQLTDGQNAIPNYMSIGRMIENITILDANTISTSGTESSQQVKNGKIENTQHTFFHTWMRKFGTWKLTTKSYQ